MEKLDIVYNTISDKETLNNTRLSVVLSTDGLCSFIQGTNDEGAILNYNTASIKEQCKVLSGIIEEYHVSDIDLYYSNDRFSLIPRKLFLYGYEKDYVRNVFPTSQQDVLFNDQIGSLEAVNIYAYSLISDLEIRQKFPGIKTKHLATALIEHWLTKQDGIYCYFLPKSFYLIDKYNGKIHCNARHAYQSVDDVVYAISNWRTASKHQNPIYIAGLQESDSSFFEALQEHLGRINVCAESLWENSRLIFK